VDRVENGMGAQGQVCPRVQIVATILASPRGLALWRTHRGGFTAPISSPP